MPKDDINNPYYQLKLRVRSQLPEANVSLEKIVTAFRVAVRSERVNLSRANQRRLLKDILGEMADELLGFQ